MKYKDLKWLQEVSEALDRNHDVRDFVLLCAQDHPDLFSRLVERVQSKDFDVKPVELAIQESTVPPGPPRLCYIQNGVIADLTYAQYGELCSLGGYQQVTAADKLLEFLPHLSKEEAYAWVRGLPNIKSYR